MTLLAYVRRLYWKRVRRYDSEICGTSAARNEVVLRYGCGRPVELVWWAPDPLWRMIVGGPGGLLCPRCFDRACRDRSHYLIWEPGPL